jgi:hypothetical protein
MRAFLPMDPSGLRGHVQGMFHPRLVLFQYYAPCESALSKADTVALVDAISRRIFMRRWADQFNRSTLSHFLNSPAGRAFRLIAGTAFLLVGILYREDILGILSITWGVFPFSAGAFDVCYISAALGGPFSGATIRRQFGTS